MLINKKLLFSENVSIKAFFVFNKRLNYLKNYKNLFLSIYIYI